MFVSFKFRSFFSFSLSSYLFVSILKSFCWSVIYFLLFFMWLEKNYILLNSDKLLRTKIDLLFVLFVLNVFFSLLFVWTNFRCQRKWQLICKNSLCFLLFFYCSCLCSLSMDSLDWFFFFINIRICWFLVLKNYFF